MPADPESGTKSRRNNGRNNDSINKTNPQRRIWYSIEKWFLRRNHERIIAYSTLILALATMALAMVTCSTDETTRAALIVSNRAWVAIEAVGDEFHSPYFIIKMRYHNLGKSPAIGVTFRYPMIVYYTNFSPKRSNVDSVKWPTVNACKGQVVSAHGMVDFPDPQQWYTEYYSMTDIPVEEFKGILNGYRGMMLVGCITYLTFGEVHHTQFCFFEHIFPNKQVFAAQCDQGADAD